jgi:hypothetical protein
MNQLPIIQSIGPAPERHADRIVAEMLKWIVANYAAYWPIIRTTLETADGNPAAQQRMYRKLKAAVGKFLLASELTPGKRGRYRLAFSCFAGWDPERKMLIDVDDPIPAKPWIALTLVQVEGKGNFKYNNFVTAALMITHHALSRLAQRCDARTIDDVFDAVLRITDGYMTRQMNNDFSSPRDGDRLKVELRHGSAVCVLCRSADVEDGAVVATLWRDDEIAVTTENGKS